MLHLFLLLQACTLDLTDEAFCASATESAAEDCSELAYDDCRASIAPVDLDCRACWLNSTSYDVDADGACVIVSAGACDGCTFGQLTP